MSDPLLPLNSQPGTTSYPTGLGSAVSSGQGGVATTTTTPAGAAPSSSAAGQTSQYTGSAQPNKFAPTGGTGDTTTFSQVQAAGQQAGLPYVPEPALAAADAKTQGTAGRNTISQAIMQPATEPAARAAQVQQVGSAMVDPSYSGINPMTLAMLALYDSQNEKDKDLSYAQNRLSMYQVMSKKMADYASYLETVQRDLDTATTSEKDDKKKSNVHVLCNQQLDFSADSMVSLDANGAYNVKNLAEGKSDKTNQITATGLTTRLQLFGQQRDLLQKSIDKWTTQYQNGLQEKNNLAQNVSQLIKDVRDANLATSHNI